MIDVSDHLNRAVVVASWISNGYFNLYSWFDGDRGDLLDDLGRRMKIDHALVDSHLEAIPGFGTFSTRSLSGGDPQGLGWHSYWSLDLKIFSLAPLIKSLQTFSKDFTVREVKVIRMR